MLSTLSLPIRFVITSKDNVRFALYMCMKNVFMDLLIYFAAILAIVAFAKKRQTCQGEGALGLGCTKSQPMCRV